MTCEKAALTLCGEIILVKILCQLVQQSSDCLEFCCCIVSSRPLSLRYNIGQWGRKFTSAGEISSRELPNGGHCGRRRGRGRRLGAAWLQPRLRLLVTLSDLFESSLQLQMGQTVDELDQIAPGFGFRDPAAECPPPHMVGEMTPYLCPCSFKLKKPKECGIRDTSQLSDSHTAQIKGDTTCHMFRCRRFLDATQTVQQPLQQVCYMWDRRIGRACVTFITAVEE